MEGAIELEPRLPATHGSRRLAFGLAAFGLAMAGFSFASGVVARTRGGTYEATLAGDIGAFSLSVTLLVLGLILRMRRPENRIGWVFLALGTATTISGVAWGQMVLATTPGGDATFGAIVSLLGAAFSNAAWAYLITALIVRFPNGAPESRREAALLRWTPVILAVSAAAILIRPGPIVVYPAFENPIRLPTESSDILLVLTSIAIAASLVPPGLAVLAMVGRYRRAAQIERAQLRWFAFGGAILIAAGIAYTVVGVLVASDNTTIRELTFVLFVLSACSLPVAVFVAITRHRLYDIDTIIGRTVAYAALTAILAGLYAASVRLFNSLFVALTGQGSEAALVLTTLVLATTFTPIKTSLERAAARRFPAATSQAVVAADAGAIASPGDLDARIETIARRVAKEVLASRARR